MASTIESSYGAKLRKAQDLLTYIQSFAGCKFRSHPDTHSENIRTVIPGLSGHPFWIYPDSHSGFIRTLF